MLYSVLRTYGTYCTISLHTLSTALSQPRPSKLICQTLPERDTCSTNGACNRDISLACQTHCSVLQEATHNLTPMQMSKSFANLSAHQSEPHQSCCLASVSGSDLRKWGDDAEGLLSHFRGGGDE